MADEPAMSPPVPQIPLSTIGSAVAPVIYFEGAPNFGFNEGVANITLEALVYSSVNGAIITERQTVAHLRMSAQGLARLKNAIAGIELLANPAPEGRAN
jgi:hypothetical protein